MNWFRLKGCAKCGGDLVLDDLDWLCLQCGTYYYTGLYQSKNGLKRPESNGPIPRKEKPAATDVHNAGTCQLGVPAFAVFDSLIRQTVGDSSTTLNLNLTSVAVNGAEA